MPKIFISYRRADSRAHTGRLYDRLVAAFGESNVFMDVNNNNIPLGRDFRDVLRDSVAACDVLLALIGRSWLNIADENGTRRLENPNDFVRIEVESALQRHDCLVIPVILDHASIPDAEELPDSLRELAYKNAAIVRDDPDFHPDVNKIIQAIQSLQSGVQVSTALSAPATPSTPFNIHDAIDRYHAAFDTKHWEQARTILNEIRASSARIPRTFDLDAHESDLWVELENYDRESEYTVIRRMTKAANPNVKRIWEALQTFWDSYPDYDPDDLARFRPLTAQEYFARGEEARLNEDYHAAIADFTEAIRLDPTFATAYNNRGFAYQKIGHQEGANADFTEAIRLNPLHANAYNNRGAFYNTKKDYTRALADLNEAIRLNPYYANAYAHRGHSYFGMGDYARALADYETALRYDASHPYAEQDRQRAIKALEEKK